jgi:methylenetetrahydrofolate reductase (NADPH)
MSGQQDPEHAEMVRMRIEQLVRTADIEVIPLKGADAKLSVVPPGTTVSVTCSPRFGLGRTLEHCARAAAAGYRVVPHLAARQVADEGELRGFVGRLDELGITDLYVIGGDAGDPAGAYSDAGDVLEALPGFPHGITSVGVACYPEGHPKIADERLSEALRRKQPHADYMVSQLCFDPEVLVSWLRRTRMAGITLPLRIGLAAPLKTRKLVELSLRIGVSSSLRYLTKQHGVIGNLMLSGSYRPETFLQGLGESLLSDELAIASVHLFSFNQLDATTDWQRRVRITA